MIKCCHLISGGFWAGAEAMAFSLLKGLLTHPNLKISAILFNEGTLANRIKALNIPVYILDETKMNFIQILFGLKSILKRQSVNIIHSHGYKENILSFMASRFRKEVCLFATQHGFPETYGRTMDLKYQFLSNLNFYLLSHFFKCIAAVSVDIKNKLVMQHRFNEEKIAMIHNGIEIPPELPRKKNDGTYVIGSSGRFFPVKNYPLMVGVAKDVYRKNNRIKFELAGTGPDERKIKTLINEYDLENVFALKGFVDNISEYYKGLDIYLNTSIHEGIPLSILEAMSHGLPVIAPNVGGIKEILEHGKQGFLVNGHQSWDFAEKCLKLYERPKLRIDMASAAREKVVKEFSMDNMANLYCQKYIEATSHSK